MKNEIIEKLHAFITADILNQPDKKIDSTSPILSTGVVDSFSLIDISMYIEENFDVLIENTELNVNYFDTLAELADLILEKKNNSA